MTFAPVSGTVAAVFLALTVGAGFLFGTILWARERVLDRHTAQLITLARRIQSLADFLDVDIHDERDDSPAALAGDDAPTDEFPVAPATVPDGIPLQVYGALIEQAPAPHRDDAAMVERAVNIGGTVQTFRIRAPRKDAT